MGGPETVELDSGSEPWAWAIHDKRVAMRWQRRAGFLGPSPNWIQGRAWKYQLKILFVKRVQRTALRYFLLETAT